MKKIVFALAVLAVVSCKKEEAKPIDYALFSGKITNVNTDSVYVRNTNFNKAIPIQKDGTFSDTLQLNDGNYDVKIGDETSSLQIKQGDNLHLTIDTKVFDETISYTGKGANRNNYLAKAYLIEESFDTNNDRKTLYNLEMDDFIAKIKGLETATDSLLNTFKIEDTDFIATQKKNTHYSFLSKIKGYPGFQKRFNEGKIVTLPENFTKEIENLNFDNATDFDNSPAYKQMVMNDFFTKSFDFKKKDSLLSLPLAMIKQLKTIKSQNIKENLMGMVARNIKPGNDESEIIYNSLSTLTKNTKFKALLDSKFEATKKFATGKTSPVFENYENAKGGKTSLSDLKGKYVYIDVWATWCAPCKREIPFLQEIEKEYHGKNIEFVSISVDKANAHQTWVDMVKEKELGGIQLFADNDFSSKFITAYGINSIPRFILLDPQGNIVNADAPRPSNPKLKELLTTQGL